MKMTMPVFPKKDLSCPAMGEVAVARLTGIALGHDQSCARNVALAYALDPLTGKVKDDPLHDAVRRSTHFQVTQQVPLRGIEATLRPDLSIAGREGGEPAFQLLIEAKLDGKFHLLAGLSQPAAYVVAWRGMPKVDEAPVRRVGTLTRGAFDWRSDVPVDPTAGVQATHADRTWLDLAVFISDAISRRCELDDTGHAEPVGPTFLMAWLLQEVHPFAGQKRDRRVNRSVPDDWLAKLLRAVAKSTEINKRRGALNRLRGNDEQLSPLTDSSARLIRHVVPKSTSYWYQ